MPTITLPYSKAGYYSDLILDYLEKKPELKAFYNRFPSVPAFGQQIEERSSSFSSDIRESLATVLQSQYAGSEASEATLDNIELLKQDNSYSITTGHQLNLFSGPLYFLYKIFSVINLCERLKVEYPDKNFVPVFWMASEDHDFDEINYFNLHGKKFQWQRDAAGAVGELPTDGLEDVAGLLGSELGGSKNGLFLTDLFKAAYLKHQNLSEATRYLANALFAKYGLVIIDGDDQGLKRHVAPYFKRELLDQLTEQKVVSTSEQLEALGYKRQVNPRQINLFYLQPGSRSRIIVTETGYALSDGSLLWTQEEILEELEKHPERFSPNALLRPLYQEVILPNLCYIGGGGELAYWMQLKSCFEAFEVPFPMIMLRNSALLSSSKQWKKFENFDIPVDWLFLKQQELINRYTHKLSEVKIDFSSQKAYLVDQFKALHDLASQTDRSFEGAGAAQEKKQLNGLDRLEKRLLKAQKRKLADHLDRLTDLQNELFPRNSLQERGVNFAEFFLLWDEDLMSRLKRDLDPLNSEFSIVVMAD